MIGSINNPVCHDARKSRLRSDKQSFKGLFSVSKHKNTQNKRKNDLTLQKCKLFVKRSESFSIRVNSQSKSIGIYYNFLILFYKERVT